jgi:hypothetical protein
MRKDCSVSLTTRCHTTHTLHHKTASFVQQHCQGNMFASSLPLPLPPCLTPPSSTSLLQRPPQRAGPFLHQDTPLPRPTPAIAPTAAPPYLTMTLLFSPNSKALRFMLRLVRILSALALGPPLRLSSKSNAEPQNRQRPKQRKTRNLLLPLAALKQSQRSKRSRRSSSPLPKLELPRRLPKPKNSASSWPKPPQRLHLSTVWGPVPLAPIKRAKGMLGFLHHALADRQYTSSLLTGRQHWPIKESVCILHSDFLSANYPLQGRTYLPKEATAWAQVMMTFLWLAKTQAKAPVVILNLLL